MKHSKTPLSSTQTSEPATQLKSSSESSPSDSSAQNSRDLVVLQGRTEDQKGYKILRASSDRIEAGELRPLEEGKPVYGDVVELEQHKDAPFLFDVKNDQAETSDAREPESQVPHASSETLPGMLAKELTQKYREQQHREKARQFAGNKKPAKVTSQAYRSNWDQIWASSAKKNHKPN